MLLAILFGGFFFSFKAERVEAFVLQTPAQIEDFIIYHAMKQGVSVPLALGIARCESNLNPLAKAKTSSASGVFQFIRGTWSETVRRMLWEPNQDVFDPRLNIVAGIWLLKVDGPGHWECFTEKMF